MIRRTALSTLAALAVAAAGCGDDSGGNGGGSGGPVTRPSGHVAVNFTVDDTANGVYGEGDLQWTGTLRYAERTRVVSYDVNGNGPFPTLWDDGPWTAGGHEPEGEVAGDGRWGITVFIAPPGSASASLDFTYRVSDASYAAVPPEGFGSGDVWPGPSGEFSIPGGGTAVDLTLDELVFAPFGSTDVKLVLDLGALAPGAWDTSRVHVHSSWFPWADVRLLDDGTRGDDAAGDGRVTLLLSEVVGAGDAFAHTGLPPAGAAVDFHFVLGDAPYRAGDAALADGVTAFTQAQGGALEPAALTAAGGELRLQVP